MAQPLRISSADGCEPVIPVTTVSARVTRTTSTRLVLRSSVRQWVNADLIPGDDWSPSPDVHAFKWQFFPEWHQDSKCRSVSVQDADRLFFGERDEEGIKATMTVKELREIKAFCQSCPVWETCLRHSLSTPERHGIWAGTSKRTRLRILVLIDSGDTTIDQVVEDYKAGREKRYESIRPS
jgi:hypothetical protein